MMSRDDPALAQATAIGAVVREVLDGDAIGAYLHGSAVLGGLRPNSDIDVLAICGRPTTDAEKRRLIERLTRISRRGDASLRSVELELLVHDRVRPWHYPPRVDFKYGDWLGAEFGLGDVWDADLLPRVRPHVDHVLGEIQRTAGVPGTSRWEDAS